MRGIGIESSLIDQGNPIVFPVTHPRSATKSAALALFILALLLTALPAASAQPADVWAPIRFMQGAWQGTSDGEPGKGTVERTYALVLKDRFIHERNIST